jgi:hypothetical protein
LDIGKLGKATPIADVPFAKQNNTKKLQHKKKTRNFQREKLRNYLNNQILKHPPVDELSCAHYKQKNFYQTMLWSLLQI